MYAALSAELYWLTLTVILTALLWVPYIINRMAEHGPWPAVWNPQPDTRPKAAWAERLMRAHANAIENLAVWAPLVLMLHVTGASTPATVTASIIYFFARLAHALLYTFGVPLLRTVAFAVGVVAQMVVALTLLGLL
jgi:uncharacterized MAPEG superfamily protein